MNPESAADYLKQTNWKALVEWLTAEAILVRPEDPLQFCRDLLGEKIVERGKCDFQADQTTGYLNMCYARATAMVDEHGMMKGKRLPSAQESAVELLAAARIKLEGMRKLLDVSAAISSLDSSTVAQNALTEIIRILHCDRSFVYIEDPISSEVIVHSSVAPGHSHRIPYDNSFKFGLPGSAIDTDSIINLDDPYGDSRFDKSLDQSTGYHTTTVLCVPVKGPKGVILGAVQGVNKVDDLFNRVDEELIQTLASQIGLSITVANSYKYSETSRIKQTICLDLLSSLQVSSKEHMLSELIAGCLDMLDADRCTLYCIDRKNTSMFEMKDEGNTQVSIDRGILAAIVASGEVLNVREPYENPLFNAAQDKMTGYVTQALLFVPLKSAGRILGILQFINKAPSSDYKSFSTEDENIIKHFSGLFAPVLLNSGLYSKINSQSSQNSQKEKDAKRSSYSESD